MTREIEREARDAHLFLAVSVDEAEVVDLRRSPLQAQEVSPSLLARDVTQTGRGKDADDLGLHAVHELRYGQRGARRLDALDLQDGSLTLLVREVELDEASRDERAANERAKDERVLPEQPALSLPQRCSRAEHRRVILAR